MRTLLLCWLMAMASLPLVAQIEVPDLPLPDEEEEMPIEDDLPPEEPFVDSPPPFDTGGYGLFDSEELFECTIKSDFVTFLADRSGSAEEQLAVISYQMPNGAQMDLPVEIEVRGHYRRDPLVCYFPPIRLDFDKDLTLPAPFMQQNKIKVVTHCHEDQYIFREYYLYKVYRMFTERSFRVRLARITYQDINGARPTETRYGFFIESEEEMAARLGGAPLDDEVPLTSEDVDQTQLAMVHLFNYMIANKDFDVQVRQNVKIVERSGKKPLVIPYDFDWSGMVNAPYTKLRAETGPVYEDRQRYQPLCLSEEAYAKLIEQFEARKDKIFALYDQSPYLAEEQVKEMLGYYTQFYRTLSKRKTVREVFRKGCE